MNPQSSTSGVETATMPEEHSLIAQLHELLTYLNRRGIITLLLLAQQGVLGNVENPVDLSFLSDTVLLLRFFEAAGRLRRADAGASIKCRYR